MVCGGFRYSGEAYANIIADFDCFTSLPLGTDKIVNGKCFLTWIGESR